MAIVVFVRGANVGGHRRFRPSVVAKELQRYGVVNVGATGLFVVRNPGSPQKFRAELLRHLPFDTHVVSCDARDILVIHITPAERSGIPTTSPEIMNRTQEISFNTALIREMRALAFVNRRIEEGKMTGGKRVFVHLIEAEDLISKFSWSSRLNGDWNFLTHLYELGRGRANNWLETNFDRLGIESTIDLEEKYF